MWFWSDYILKYILCKNEAVPQWIGEVAFEWVKTKKKTDDFFEVIRSVDDRLCALKWDTKNTHKHIDAYLKWNRNQVFWNDNQSQ